MNQREATGKLDTRGIDGLRGIAAVGIALFAHYYFFVPELNYPFYNRLTYWFWNYASYFVDLFFVISGFVMVHAYRDKIKLQKIGFTDFVKKRLVRFYPLMVFSLFCVLVLQLVHQAATGVFFVNELIYDNSVWTFLLNLLCLQGTSLLGSSFNAPSWYLSIVLIMYVLFFLGTYWSGKYNKENLFYGAMVLLGIVIAVKGYPVVFLNCRGMIGFFTGCLLHEACVRIQSMETVRGKNMLVGTALAILLGICILGAWKGHAVFAPSTLVVVVYGILIWPLCVLLAVHMPFVRWILSRKMFVFLSGISFSMYLIHFPVMVFLEDVNVLFGLGLNYASRKVFVLYVCLLMVAAMLCHYIVERKLSDFFGGKKNEKKL